MDVIPSLGRGTAACKFGRSWHIALTTVILVWAASARPAEACSCFANPPCAAVWKADAVFVGTAIDRVQEPVGGSISWTVHKVAVNERLHGTVDAFITLVPGHRPSAKEIEASKSHSALERLSTCDYNFELGRKYVIYARKTADGRWTTSMCSGTKLLEEADDDLDYIASIPAAEPTGRIYGSIERTVLASSDRRSSKSVPATGIPVALTNSSNRLTVTTDSQGQLDVRVPPGEYSIAPVVPETVLVYGSPLRTTVAARGCAPVYFSLISNGRIEGRVVRQDGTVVPSVSVSMIPADSAENEPPQDITTARGALTDASGQFALDAILPGRYVLGVNARLGPTLSNPYAATYFPNVARKAAQPIDIADGERKTGFTIVVTPLPETTVSGLVLFSDRPAVNARVTAWTLDHEHPLAHANTSDVGAFRLRVLAGFSYVIRATVQTESGLEQTEGTVLVDGQKAGLRLVIRP